MLLHPTHPRVAPRHGQTVGKPWLLTTTAVFNLACVPVAQIPLGLNKRGLPLGVQAAAGPDRDHVAVAVALELERAFGGWVPPTDPRSAVVSEPVRHHCLFYDYVENAVEKRAPYRADHLAHARAWKEDGRIVMAGALGDPPHGGAVRLPRRRSGADRGVRRRRSVRRGRHRHGAPRRALDRRDLA